MRSAFRGEAAKQKLVDWYERFAAKIGRTTERREVPTRFGRTHVLIGGPPQGQPVVLLHGAMASSAHVMRELSGLLDTFRVYSVDVLGQSVMSEDRRPAVTNDDYGHWLAEVMDGLALPRAHVIGVSWGGFCAVRLAVVAPSRIDHLALLVPAGLVNGYAWAGLVKLALPMALYRLSPTPRRLRAFTQNLLSTLDDEWMPYLGDAFLSYDLDMRVPKLATADELQRLTAPTLIIAAEGDLSFPGAKLLERAPALFGPRLVATELLRGARHSPPTTDEFRRFMADRLSGFLLDRPAARAA